MGLDSVEWVLVLEDEFKVKIPDEVAVTLRTPRAAAGFIVQLVDPRLWRRDLVEQRVLKVTGELFGRPVDEVRLDSDIVHDLGAD